jgi:HTH-type transcriptional regulator/antitoxin HipB
MRISTPRDIGAAIRERRRLLGLDQAELASRVGVSRQWLIQVENGKAGATIGLLLRLMNALDINLMLDAGGRGATPGATALDLPDPSAILDRARKGGPPT